MLTSTTAISFVPLKPKPGLNGPPAICGAKHQSNECEGRFIANHREQANQSLRSNRCYPDPAMEVKALTPILNVSDIGSTFSWFEKWGWKKLWDWGTPPTFGAVGSGKARIFLCQGAQGGRGRGANTTTFQREGDKEADKGVWMFIWVANVDEMHKHCVAAGLEVTFPPIDMPWDVREMHLRHPDGHVFRVGQGLEHEE